MVFKNISSTFDVEIVTENKNPISKSKYVLLKLWYRFILSLLKLLKFIPKANRISTTYYRKLSILELVYVNQIAECWYCNFCGNVVFKGALKNSDSILMNCPHCLSVYQVSPDYNKKLYQKTAGKGKDDTPKFVTENSTIDNGVRYDEKICGIKYGIKEKY